MQTNASAFAENEFYLVPAQKQVKSAKSVVDGLNAQYENLRAMALEAEKSIGSGLEGESVAAIDDYARGITRFLKSTSMEIYLPLGRGLMDVKDSSVLRKLEYYTRMFCRRISMLKDRVKDLGVANMAAAGEQISAMQLMLENHHQLEERHLMPIYHRIMQAPQAK